MVLAFASMDGIIFDVMSYNATRPHTLHPNGTPVGKSLGHDPGLEFNGGETPTNYDAP